MIEATAWLAACALIVIGGLICYSAWTGLLSEDDKLRSDEKRRNRHRWQGGHGRR